MSRTISAALKTHMAEDVTTLATCWRVVRLDATEFFFTSHDVDLVIDGDTYLAATGVLPTAISQNPTLAVDNLEVLSTLDSAQIAEADILAGLFDYAALDIFLVNYADLTQGKLYLAQDWVLGEVSINDNTFRAECRGKSQHFSQNVLDLYTPECRADLGDAQCGVDLADSAQTFWGNGSVTAVTSRRVFEDGNSDRSETEDVFTYGKLTWTSGNNNGRSMEVKTFTPASSAGDATFELFEPMSADIQVGDTYDVTYGCDKDKATCVAKFSNLVNFRGEPFVPGLDILLDVGRY